MSAENRDEIFIRVVGNLISEPILHHDHKGRKTCFCKLASNPPAKKFNPKTGEAIPNKERTKTRSVFQLQINNLAEIETFMNNYHMGDRLQIEGFAVNKNIPKMVYSRAESKWVPCIIDVDGDGYLIENITEGRLTLEVSRCIPIYLNTTSGKEFKLYPVTENTSVATI